MKALISSFSLFCLLAVNCFGQTLIDSYADGNFSASPAWTGDANWTVVANSDVAAGATGSNTLRLNVGTGAGIQHLRTQIATWGTTQEWIFFVGRRAQAYTLSNNLEIWLYGNEADLENATVDGYALLIGEDTGDDEIRLARMTNGASASTVITGATAIPNGQTDFGMLIRVTRNASGVWNLFTSVVPTSNGGGAVASAATNGNTAYINQGSGTDNTHSIAANGYFGLVAVHSSGADGRAAVEFDQFHFTPGPSSIAIADGTVAAGNVTQGTTDNVLYRIDLTPSTANATLGSVVVTTAGTYQTSDIQTNGMKLRYSTDATLDGLDATLASIAPVASGSQLAFTGLTQALTSGSTYYLFITADIAASAVAARTLNIATTAFASATNRITFNSGLTTGTSPLAAGGLKTIVAGVSAPSITTPTATSILTTTATLGATITNDNGASITARGTVWKASAGVTISDNQLAEGGTSVSAFSHSRGTFAAGTQVFYRGYATNSQGTTLSPEASFYTLSLEPTAHAASFSASPASSSQINLTFTAASSITNAAGYIILQRAGAAPTGTPADASAYTVGNTIGDATVAALISSTSTTSASITGLSGGTQYYFTLIPFGYNGSNSQTYNYYTGATIPETNATTNFSITPASGDIAFTAMQVSSVEGGEFITLKRIDLRNLNLTDNGVQSDNTVGTGEGTYTFPNTTAFADVPAGTLIRFTESTGTDNTVTNDGIIELYGNGSNCFSIGSFALSTSGDQIIAYTGTAASPTYIAGITGAAGVANWNATPSGSNESKAPGTSSDFYYGTADNAYFTGTVTGTPATIRTALVNSGNYTTSGTAFAVGTYLGNKSILFSQSDFATGSISTSAITTTSATLDASALSFSSATQATTRYAVVIRATSAPDAPADRYTCYTGTLDDNSANFSTDPSVVSSGVTAPCAGTAGNGKVIYIGYTLPTALAISNLAAGTTYEVRVYALNGNGWSANFGTAASGSFTTSAGTAEINIQGNSTTIADGDMSPSTADHTDFGGVLVSAGTIVRTFTIQNTGGANLNLTGAPLVDISGTDAADFSVTTVPTSPVAAAGSVTFQVTFNPSAPGTRSASISIDNSDSDENPYNFNIQGTGLVPEIQLEQPVATNQACGFNYDYGSQLLSTNTDVTVRIRNTGDGALESVSVALSGLDAPEFSFFTSPSATIAPAGFSDFVIRFTPTTGGSKVAVVTISSSDDDEATCVINLYGEGDATPVVPTLTTPTVSSITNNSAILGATLTNDGNASITARGTVWKASAGVTSSDNALAEGGTSVAGFSHSRTSLPAGTRIYYRGYATNSAGTGLSPESDFYTLSNEPVAGPASFTATAVSATQINLNFSAASTIPASGYVILIKAGSAVTGTPSDATAYALNDGIGDANVTALITTATSFSVTGLSASTNYHFAVFPFSWNGTNNETRNYRITTPAVANATTSAAALPVLGDIAFVAYATDAPDRFAFVALADIAANAEIAFTDNAWSSGSALCTNEETVRWKALASGVSKGTVIRVQGTTANVGSIVSGNLNNLSSTSDQIFAYTGTAGSPTFIAGLSSTSFAGTCHACTNTNTSCIASGLTNGTNAISFASHSDNGYYNGPTYGTVATLRSSINNPANWVRSNSNQTWPTPWSFVIGNVSITTGTITGSPFCITNTAGTAVSVPFTTGGTFETGNVFTAQLSDASGSFAIPTDIGTGTGSPISATIPAGKPSGSGYRIRVISSDPEANGLQNTSNLTIFLNTPDVTGVSALRQNGGAIVSWTNPGGCWDQVLVVTQPTNAVTAVPSGDGSAYTANSTFLSGTAFGTGGSVVFKGTTNNVTITGFTNATTYFVKVFVRRGTVWSDGVEVSVVPSPDITGDFRSRVATGNWSDFNSWQRFNGTAWVNATSGQFPDNTTTTVTIQNGHTITVDGSSDPYDVRNLIVSAGGKLYANLTTGNRYLSVYGDITCNGTVGNGSTFDGISFNFEGAKATVSGTGTFDCSRMRKSTRTPNAVTDLILAMNVNLRWNNSSGTAIYNNVGGTAGSRFNVTVNENTVLSCILSAGGTSGNASIDGVDGGNSASDRAAGTFTINGTMNIPGTLFATTDNDATGGFFCRWVIGSTGVINCRQLDCSSSGAAGHTLEIKQGGKLNINNNNDNTVNPIVNFSTTNNTYTFENGSTVEYSSTDLAGSQKIFNNAAFPYRNLLLSGPSTKQLQTAGTLTVNGNLTITGGLLDIQTNNIDLKGNWQNYNQSGFTEGIQKVTFSGIGLQTVTCVGGEQFYNVDVTNSSVAGVRLDADVTLANDLDLGSSGRLSFGPTPTTLTLSKMTAGSNTLKGSGTANIDMSAAEHILIIGCPDPGYTGTLNAGTTSTLIYNRDEDFAGSTDDQNILTGFAYANLLMQGKGNKVVSDNLTVTGNFTAETPDLVLSVPVANRTMTLGGNFTLNSGATMNDNCRQNQEIVTSGNALQLFNTNTKNLKAFNLKSVKSAGGISLNGDVADQTRVNLQNDLALDFTGTAVFSDNGNNLIVGDDAELGSATSTASNFNLTGTMQFNGLGAATDIHLSDYAGTGRCRAELNNLIIRAGENATTDQLEVYPGSGGQTLTVKGNLEIIQGANSSEFDLNGNTLNLKGNWTSYDENAFNEGTNSTVVFNGTAAQTITVPTKEKFANLTWDNTNNLSLSSDLEAVTNLTVSNGSVITSSNKVILGPTATIIESNAHQIVGVVETTRNLSLTNHAFGGLGVEIDADGNTPGSTFVRRTTGVEYSNVYGHVSILRKFTVIPATNTGLNATLVFRYFDGELNNRSEGGLVLFRSTDGGAIWTMRGGIVNPSANTITLSLVDAFSEWTAAENELPLPLVMGNLVGKVMDGNAQLQWFATSEGETIKEMRLEKSLDGKSFSIDKLVAENQVIEPGNFQIEDKNFFQAAYYRIALVGISGEVKHSNIVFLTTNATSPSMFVSPNPSQAAFEIRFQEISKDDWVELMLSDLSGKVIYENHGPAYLMEQYFHQISYALAAGTFVLHAHNSQFRQVSRLVKKP